MQTFNPEYGQAYFAKLITLEIALSRSSNPEELSGYDQSGCHFPVAVRATRGTSGKRSAYDRETDIFRAEVVPPLRYAMRLVDRKQGDRRAVQHGKAPRCHQSLGASRADQDRRPGAGLDGGGFAKGKRGMSNRRLTPASSNPAT